MKPLRPANVCILSGTRECKEEAPGGSKAGRRGRGREKGRGREEERRREKNVMRT